VSFAIKKANQLDQEPTLMKEMLMKELTTANNIMVRLRGRATLGKTMVGEVTTTFKPQK
jgi:hypothetical protein